MASALTTTRRVLWNTQRQLGDVNAVVRAVQTRSPKPILRRVFNKGYGRLAGRGFLR